MHQRRKGGVGKLKDLLSVTGFGKKGKIEIDECITQQELLGGGCVTKAVDKTQPVEMTD